MLKTKNSTKIWRANESCNDAVFSAQ